MKKGFPSELKELIVQNRNTWGFKDRDRASTASVMVPSNIRTLWMLLTNYKYIDPFLYHFTVLVFFLGNSYLQSLWLIIIHVYQYLYLPLSHQSILCSKDMWVHQIKNSLTPPMPELKATPTEQTELFPSAATFQKLG